MLDILDQLAQTLLPLSSSRHLAFLFFFLISFLVGIISAMFGIGGGFFFTPFFHSVLGLPPVQAVATSMFQIPFMSASGSFTYLRKKKVEIKAAFWLLSGALFSSQITAFVFSYFSIKDKSNLEKSNIDIFLIILYTLVIGGLGFYTLFKKSQADVPAVNVGETAQNKNLEIPKLSILLTGLLFGFISSALGVGGGFLSVPYFIYALKMPTAKATATSLFTMFFISLITSLQYLWLKQPYVILSLFAALGTMSGAQVGSRIALGLPSHILKRSFAVIQILVVIVYLFRELPKFF